MNSIANSFVAIFPEDWDPDNPDTKPNIVRYDQFVGQLFKAGTAYEMKSHAVMGICGEAGELTDAIKKEIVYGKTPDRKNIIEELGDIRFYIQAIQNLYRISEQEILQANANKLATRYRGLRYTDAAAIARKDKNDGET